MAIVVMSRVFTNNPGDLNSVLGRVIPKTQKMLNIQHYKVRSKNKVEQIRKWSSAFPYTSV